MVLGLGFELRLGLVEGQEVSREGWGQGKELGNILGMGKSF